MARYRRNGHSVHCDDCNTERHVVRAEVQSNLEVCEQRHGRIWRQWCRSGLHKANALLFHSRGAPAVLLRDERRDAAMQFLTAIFASRAGVIYDPVVQSCLFE
eukprot:COSAG04_NODE_10095_length_804_cov_1.554610_2_plen_103_part_00